MTQTLTIDKGIAIPARRKGKYGICRYPFQAMQAGDSFLLAQNGPGKGMVERERCLVLLTARKYKVQVTTRRVPGGIRVWKVK